MNLVKRKSKLLEECIVIFIVIFIFLAAAWVFSKLIERSIWLDEAMLLKNIEYSYEWLDYFKPLLFYDQVQPAIITIFHNIIFHHISEDLIVFRLSMLLVMSLITIPFFVALIKNKIEILLVLLIVYNFIFQIAFFFTEIKHYGFEVAACFLMIAAMYLGLMKRINFAFSVISISIVAILGFSTLIPAFVMIVFLTIVEIREDYKSFLKFQNIIAVLISGIVGFLVLWNMKELSLYQMNNYDAYLSRGFNEDLRVLLNLYIEIHSRTIALIVFFMLVVGLLSGKDGLYYKFTLVYIGIIFLVLIGKLSGFYPVAYSRHLAWLIPFAFIIIFLGFVYCRLGKSLIMKLIYFMLISILLLQATKIFYRSIYDENTEITSNNSLYKVLSEIKPSIVMVYPYAQPSLEYYMKVNPELNKHKYIGIVEEVSSLKDGSTLQRFKRRVDLDFYSVPDERFIYLISHGESIGGNDLYRGNDVYINYIVGKFKQSNCDYYAIYSGKRAQMLEVICHSNSR